MCYLLPSPWVGSHQSYDYPLLFFSLDRETTSKLSFEQGETRSSEHECVGMPELSPMVAKEDRVNTSLVFVDQQLTTALLTLHESER